MQTVAISFTRLSRSEKGNRFAVSGRTPTVAAEVLNGDVPCGHGRGKIVRLLVAGGGYPVGHVMTIGESQISTQ